jgi:transposase-like protein
VAAIQLKHAKTGKLVDWLMPYKELPFDVLATLSDGEPAIIEALETCWPAAPRQRCQAHFLNNLADPALVYDDELRKWMRQDLGGLPQAPEDPLF